MYVDRGRAETGADRGGGRKVTEEQSKLILIRVCRETEKKRQKEGQEPWMIRVQGSGFRV